VHPENVRQVGNFDYITITDRRLARRLEGLEAGRA
jgi:hypothetical protein